MGEMTEMKLERLGMIMAPRPGDPNEVEGVLNPAVARARDGQLYLFPRLVGHGNFSRIGIARVIFDKSGDPVGVERIGLALEPEADYELTGNGGGCEDPRISFLEPLQRYVMTYTALSRHGPRIAIAVSEDLLAWRRLGLVCFKGLAFEGVDDKDASIFPIAIPDPSGRPAMAMLHRPLFAGTRPEEKLRCPAPEARDVDRESIWISYCRMTAPGEVAHLSTFAEHHRLASPEAPWERLKIGGGAPPDPMPAWLAVRVSRRARTDPGDGRPRQDVLLGGCDGAFQRASEPDHLSFAGAGAGTRWSAGESRYCRQRGLSHRNRLSDRPGFARSLRHLLRHGR
jgi:predicted GH43/DUF377 family glycosyl hydrolase